MNIIFLCVDGDDVATPENNLAIQPRDVLNAPSRPLSQATVGPHPPLFRSPPTVQRVVCSSISDSAMMATVGSQNQQQVFKVEQMTTNTDTVHGVGLAQMTTANTDLTHGVGLTQMMNTTNAGITLGQVITNTNTAHGGIGMGQITNTDSAHGGMSLGQMTAVTLTNTLQGGVPPTGNVIYVVNQEAQLATPLMTAPQTTNQILLPPTELQPTGQLLQQQLATQLQRTSQLIQQQQNTVGNHPFVITQPTTTSFQEIHQNSNQNVLGPVPVITAIDGSQRLLLPQPTVVTVSQVPVGSSSILTSHQPAQMVITESTNSNNSQLLHTSNGNHFNLMQNPSVQTGHYDSQLHQCTSDNISSQGQQIMPPQVAHVLSATNENQVINSALQNTAISVSNEGTFQQGTTLNSDSPQQVTHHPASIKYIGGSGTVTVSMPCERTDNITALSPIQSKGAPVSGVTSPVVSDQLMLAVSTPETKPQSHIDSGNL